MRPETFLREIRKDGSLSSSDLHITRMCSSLVAVSGGRVIRVSEPKLRYCPLANSLYHLRDAADIELLKAKIKEAVERKIAEFGLFTDARQLYRESIAIPFGASEMIMYDLKKGGADAAVTVCDGAGTVITSNPYLVQGIGARMNGLFYTTPIPRVIARIRELGGTVPFPASAAINQLEGLKAVGKRYKKVAITINGFSGESLERIRSVEKDREVSVTLLAVCNTGIERTRAEELLWYTDLVWGCGSRWVREVVGAEAKLQVATKIPVFCLTQRALDFVSSYSTGGLKEYLAEHEGPFIITGRGGHMENVHNITRIGMGDFTTYIGEVHNLPVRSAGEPSPLL